MSATRLVVAAAIMVAAASRIPAAPTRASGALLAQSAEPAGAGPSQNARPRADPIVGLDHIPFVVRDLAAAAETYRRLGFALKPGRSHANGITNAHVKFEDGAGIELITAPAAVDDLTTQYRTLMDAAEGPAFFGLHARDADRFAAAMARAGIPYRQSDGRIGTRGLEYVFVGRDNRSPTDRPEHFAHPNGATALVRVWVAPDDPAVLRRFLEAAGGSTTRRIVSAPERVDATVVRVSNGEVVILPTARRVTPGRPIAGVTLGVTSLTGTARYLAGAGIQAGVGPDVDGARALIAPTETRGMWIEFREIR